MKKSVIFALACLLALSACKANTRTPETAATIAVSPAVTVAGAASTESSSAPGCTVVSADPTPGPTEESLFPPVSGSDWVEGAETASVTLIEYSDFQ